MYSFLGDPHLGKKFVHGVPLHRRGDRERMVEKCFTDHFATVNTPLHVCMGDIFDRPHVTEDTILLAANTYRRAVAQNPHTIYVLLAGNHDLGRDLEVKVSFDILAELIEPLGVVVVRDTPCVVNQYLMVPFSSRYTSTELVEEYKDIPLLAAFGHWDVVNPSNDRNLIPKLNTPLIVTGHDHHAREEPGLIVTGSMQPYAHGEGDMYRTVTLAELELISVEDRKNLCLRIVLAKGEVLPEDLDALQISVLRETDEKGEALAVGFEAFDMENLWTAAFNDNGVPEALRNMLFDRYRNRG